MSDKPYQGQGALDAFLNILKLITLIWLWSAVGSVLFAIIDKYVASEKMSSDIGMQLAIPVASILIVTPVFLGVSYALHQNYRNKKLNTESGIYRWLTYLLLLVSALFIIGSLIGIVSNYLTGAYTLASFLKITIMLSIAAGIFAYYWYDLKRTDYSDGSKVSVMAAGIVITVSVLTLIGGLLVVGSPKNAKLERLDNQRVWDLLQMHEHVINYYADNNRLPDNVEELAVPDLVDPTTKQPYEYHRLGEDDFQLCANFERPAPENIRHQYVNFPYPWFKHEAGRQCYDLNKIKKTEKTMIPLDSDYIRD